jgi:transposase
MKMETRRRFTPEFKAQAVELARAGRPVIELAGELKIGSNMLYRWIQQSTQVGSGGPGAEGVRSEADELRALRKENAHLKLENDILKKAAVILGTQTQPGSVR